MTTTTPPRPVALPVCVDAIPVELLEERRWVVWRYDLRLDQRTGELKWTKPPYQAGRPQSPASSTDPTTWGTHAQAVAAYQHGDADGIGFMLGDGWAGIDLDHVVDPETHTLAPWAQDEVKALATYTEYSPGGAGIRLVLRGRVPYADGRKRGDVEAYSARRFLTVTGHHLPGTPIAVEERQEALEAFCARRFPPKARLSRDRQSRQEAPREPLALDDEELIQKALAADDGGKFAALWAGQWRETGYRSPSEGVGALCFKLAFWTQKDADRMDRLFRRSGMMSDKWDDRRGDTTWGANEIADAIAITTEAYTPPALRVIQGGKEVASAEVAEDEQAAPDDRGEPRAEEDRDHGVREADGDDGDDGDDEQGEDSDGDTALAAARRRVADLVARAKADRGAAFVPDVLEALVRLQLGDTAAWVRLRDELRQVGVPVRELDKAVRRTAFRVVRGGRDDEGAQSAPSSGEPYRAVGGPYRLVNGAICLEKDTRDPLGPQAAVTVPLCNFAARIAAEQIHDDGAEQTTVLLLEGRLQYGEALPPVRIVADRYAGMGWVTASWGARAVVYAGQAMKDHLRAAIQLLSGAPPRSTIYGHTGWRKVDGTDWIYLHAGGGIGASGVEPAVQVDLHDALSRYVLPDPPAGEDLVNVIRASLRILDIAPARVMIPLYTAMWRAALGTVDFSVHVVGPTGEGKTEIATLIQQHFGAGMGTRALPANWDSTANALEALAFQTKDTILVVDDFAPHGSAADVQRFHRDADRLFRALGNASGRHRMQADTRLRPMKRPRGLIVSTGEEVPQGQSLRARLLILEHAPNTLDWQGLTTCQQDAASGRYAEALAGFVQWLAPQYEAIQERLRAEVRSLRDEATRSTLHKRTPEIVGNLALGMRYFLDYAVDAGAVTIVEREQLWTYTWDTLGQVAVAQARYQAESEPTRRFLELLIAAIASGKAHVAAPMGQEPVSPEAWGWRQRIVGTGENSREEWQPLGTRVGWFDGKALYLEPEAAYASAQAMGQQAGDGLTVSAHTLRRRLHQRGLLVSTDPRRETLTIRRILEGKQRDVLHLSPAALSPSPEPDKSDKHNRKNGEESAEPAECRVSESGAEPDNVEPDMGPTSASPHESGAAIPNVGFVGSPRGEKGSPVTTSSAEVSGAPDGVVDVGWPTKPDIETRHRPHNPTWEPTHGAREVVEPIGGSAE